jgi:hypothetical protein
LMPTKWRTRITLRVCRDDVRMGIDDRDVHVSY